MIQFPERAYAPEPHHFHRGGPVGEQGCEAHFRPLPLHLHGDKPPTHLQRRHLAAEISHTVNLRTVNIMVGIVVQKVVDRPQAKLLGAKFRIGRPYPFHILYVAFAQIHVRFCLWLGVSPRPLLCRKGW